MVITGRKTDVHISDRRGQIKEDPESHTRNIALERQKAKRLEEKKQREAENRKPDGKRIPDERDTNPKQIHQGISDRRVVYTSGNTSGKGIQMSGKGIQRTGKKAVTAVSDEMEDTADYDGRNNESRDDSEYTGRRKKMQNRVRNMIAGTVMFLVKELLQLAGAIVAVLSNMTVMVCVCIIAVVLIAVSSVGNLVIIQDGAGVSGAGFPPAVMQWQPLVAEAVERNNNPESGVDLRLFENAILATIQQESGGLPDAPGVNGDIMQCAESGYMDSCPADWPIEKKSIDAGTRVFYDALINWGVSDPNDIEGLQMVAQGYNYGPGFFDWARKNGYTVWSLDMSKEYSILMSSGSGANYGTYTYGSSWLNKLYAGGAVFDSALVGDGEYIWAVDAQFNQSGSFFGKRVPLGCPGASTWHKGIDFGVSEGCNVYAITDGVVVELSPNVDGRGNAVVIESEVSDGILRHTYMHNSAFADISVGQEVCAGQLIAYAGSTGTSTGTHCHLETRLNGVYVNPFIYCYGGITGITARDSSGNITQIDVDCTPGSWSAAAGTKWNTYYSYDNGTVVLGTGAEEMR